MKTPTILMIEAKDRYAEFLNDAYGKVSVCGCEYDAGDALRDLDPIAFDLGAGEWIDSEIESGNFKVKDYEIF